MVTSIYIIPVHLALINPVASPGDFLAYLDNPTISLTYKISLSLDIPLENENILAHLRDVKSTRSAAGGESIRRQRGYREDELKQIVENSGSRRKSYTITARRSGTRSSRCQSNGFL